ncbi:MAG: sugar phosphate isomerase/epimerase [Planctomycetales bacterium]|nr:sugar phosphate isomerase/epimerase [Planctomycetales bacterium]
MSQLTRRQWIALQTAWLAAASPSVSELLAREPITRPGVPKFKFSLAAYSYRELLTRPAADFDLDDFVDECARMQLDGTELTSYYFPTPVSRDYLANLRAKAFRLGLDVSGIAVRNDFGLPPGDARDADIAHVKASIDWACELGAPVIRVFAGQVHGDAAASHRRIVEGFEETCQYALSRGVHLALENHHGPTSTAAGLLQIVRDVQSPAFGVNLDTGNFFVDDPYVPLREIARYALNVQVKASMTRADKSKVPADFEHIAVILRDAGYRGYIVLEYEESDDPRTACPPLIDRLREAFT